MLKSGSILEEKLGEFEKALKLYQKLATERGDGTAHAAIARLTQKVARRFHRNVCSAPTKNPSSTSRSATSKSARCASTKSTSRPTSARCTASPASRASMSRSSSRTRPGRSNPTAMPNTNRSNRTSKSRSTATTPGAYVVSVGDDDWESTVLVLRSDLEVVVKSSRREVLAFVQDMLTGKPAAGVELLVSNGSRGRRHRQDRRRRRLQDLARNAQGSRRRAGLRPALRPCSRVQPAARRARTLLRPEGRRAISTPTAPPICPAKPSRCAASCAM